MKTVFLSMLLVFAASPGHAAETYEVDASHSQIGFQIKHLGISTVSGRFSNFKSSFEYDPANPEAAKASAVIDAASIDTGNEKRDEHLRSADFLDTATYPEIVFESTAVTKTGENQFEAAGDLTLHGVTKPVTLKVEYGGSAVDQRGSKRAAFAATGTINRKDFGIVYHKVLETGALMIGEEVKIAIEVEGVVKTPEAAAA